MTATDTDTSAKQPDTNKTDPGTGSNTGVRTPETSQPQSPTNDDAAVRKATSPGRVGTVFVIAAALAVGALVWAVIAGPSDTSVDTSTYDRVEANRVAVLRDLAVQPSGSYDRVEANRVAVLRDLAVQPSGSYDRVEANRVAVLRDLAGVGWSLGLSVHGIVVRLSRP